MAHINLLPWRENLRKQRQRAFVQQAGLAFLAAVGIVIFGHLFWQAKIDDQSRRNAFLSETIQEFDKQIAEIKALQETRARLVARMQVIESLQQNRSNVVHAFDALARTAPDGIVLTKVALKEDRLLEINGISDTAARVADYLRNLNSHPWLSQASIVGTGILAQELSKGGGQPLPGLEDAYAFSLTAVFGPPSSAEDTQERKER